MEDASDIVLHLNTQQQQRISIGKDGVVRVLYLGMLQEIQAVEKERKGLRIFCVWPFLMNIRLCSINKQFEAIKISNSEGLESDMTGLQQLLSQLEAHGAEVSTEDANHKFLKVFEQENSNGAPKKTSSRHQNVAFVSQSKSSNNKVKSGFSGAYSSCNPSTSSTNIPEKEVLAGLLMMMMLEIEEMDINGQIAMIAIRMKMFSKENRKEMFA
ncbi:hypothetical protein Tco_1467857 [Tanacetum coccineum]